MRRAHSSAMRSRSALSRFRVSVSGSGTRIDVPYAAVRETKEHDVVAAPQVEHGANRDRARPLHALGIVERAHAPAVREHAAAEASVELARRAGRIPVTAASDPA